MAKKEKVTIIHTDDFDEVDGALSEALAGLDQANTRVLSLLESETRDAETADLFPEADQTDTSAANGNPGEADDGAR